MFYINIYFRYGLLEFFLYSKQSAPIWQIIEIIKAEIFTALSTYDLLLLPGNKGLKEWFSLFTKVIFHLCSLSFSISTGSIPIGFAKGARRDLGGLFRLGIFFGVGEVTCSWGKLLGASFFAGFSELGSLDAVLFAGLVIPFCGFTWFSLFSLSVFVVVVGVAVAGGAKETPVIHWRKLSHFLDLGIYIFQSFWTLTSLSQGSP